MPDAIAPDGSDIYFRVLDAERASVVEVVLAAGRTSRAVRHRTVEEVWYFLAGSGDVWLRAPEGQTAETRRVDSGRGGRDPRRLGLPVPIVRHGGAAVCLLHLPAVAG